MPWLKLFPLLLTLLSFLQPLAANASTLLLPLAAAESADVSAAHRDAVSFCRSTAKGSAAVEADYERAGRASFDGVLALFFGAQLRNGLNPSTATPAPASAVVEEVGALAEEAGAKGGAGRIVVTTANGKTVPIPKGWVARTADNGKGIVYQRPGAAGNADMIRVMDPTKRYPSGYVRYFNQQGQPLDIHGKPGSNATTHISLDYEGPISGWPQ